MEILIFILLCVGGAVIIYFKYKSEQRRKKQLQAKLNHQLDTIKKAETDYRTGLSELKKMPTNADLKEIVLRLGRDYSALTRQRHGQDKTVTIFDEIALMNDINAACAAAASVQSNTKTETKQTIEQRLAKLSELKEKNLISEKEYETRRQKILDEI